LIRFVRQSATKVTNKNEKQENNNKKIRKDSLASWWGLEGAGDDAGVVELVIDDLNINETTVFQ